MSALGDGMAVWYLMRASGATALLLLSASLALGIATTRGARLGPLPGFATAALHRSVSLLAVAFLAVHVLTAIVDPYALVRLVDVVVPFGAPSRPLWVGLGALALDLLAALTLTGLVRRRIGRRTFLTVHRTAYAAWPLAVLHGVGLGTDVGAPWMTLVLTTSLGTVGAALAWRLRPRRRPVRVRPSAPAAGPGAPVYSERAAASRATPVVAKVRR